MQLSKKFDISIVIIGFNTYEPLKQLLDSINLIEINKSIEVIYIDDGSTDSSFNLFNKYIMNFSTKGHRINKNKGRAFATQKGIAMAQGEWLYFIRSNEIILKNTFSRYFKLISNKEILAVMGVVQYSSQDKQFENYLNSNYRGVSQYISGSLIPYKYLLFNNSIIHHQVFKYITINPRLNQYRELFSLFHCFLYRE
ncbi:glycosyltransferase [Candidatus Marinimicrobia bacterium]|nr:glycosyltransferase [Candidatus Neomarinimicrobiota bacterium]